MVGGNSAAANWWSLNNMRPPPPQQHQQLTGSSPLMAAPSPSSSSSSSAFPHPYSLGIQDVLPDSWSQLLLGGYVGEEERCSFTHFLPKVENWDHNHSVAPPNMVVDVKQEGCELMYGHGNTNIHEEIQLPSRNSWRSQQHMLPVSSPRSSCITTFSSNMLDFSTSKSEGKHPKHDQQPSSEEEMLTNFCFLKCNSTETASALKKPRLQVSSSPQSTTFKVRKEKLGDRITVLHQLVSPFGKTDTASVLLEAIGYIRFLQSQIEALSSPYLGNAVSTSTRHPGQGERSCIFPEDPGQLLNDACMKRRGPCESKDAKDEMTKDLRSRGLCLVPLSCTMHFGSDNGADYWAPAYGSGGGNGGFR